MSTAEQKLAAIVAILAEPNTLSAVAPGPGIGDPEPSGPLPWYRDTSSAPPVAPLNDVTNVAEIKRYLAHGYKTNFTRGVAEQDWNAALAKADAIAAGTSDIIGVFSFEADTAIEAVLGGGSQGGGIKGPESIYAPVGLDFVGMAAWLSALPNSGAGPSGQ